jgi:ketosteroid isomerase-like protein
MSSRAIAERYFQALDRGDVEGALACFAPGAEFASPMGTLPFPDGGSGQLPGPAQLTSRITSSARCLRRSSMGSPGTRVSTAISGGAPMRMGGPVVPRPRLT